jgi:hypothetical protein
VFDSDAYDKLFGSAAYDSTAIEDALGFKPHWNFRSALTHIVGSPVGGPGEEGRE